jgi:hypothetical protein
MVDYVDIQENYFVAGDFDSRKRCIRTRNGTGSLAVASGVTWSISDSPQIYLGTPWIGYRWSLGARGAVNFVSTVIDGDTRTQSVDAPSPLRVTSCII